MKATYELRRIKNSKDKDLTKALHVYSKGVDPFQRTDTREIIYWLDHYNVKFTDQFFILALYLNDELIGYTQLVHLNEERIIIADYIIIDENFRGNNTFYQFIEEIKNFFNKEEISFYYFIAEVGNFDVNNTPTQKTRNLIRLLKISGFGVLKAKYFQPMLGKNNYESEIMSVLMIYTSSEVDRIKKETFSLIITSIYFKHYKRWYDAFFDEIDQASYSAGLDKLLSVINENIRNDNFININGYSHIFKSHETKPSPKKYFRFIQFTSFVTVFLIISISVGFGVYCLQKSYGIDSADLIFIGVTTIILIISIFHIFFKSKDKPIELILEKVIQLFK